MRTKELQGMIDKISKDNFGQTQPEATQHKLCVYCGKKATKFKDQLSAKEYSISGFCQQCQDEVFG